MSVSSVDNDQQQQQSQEAETGPLENGEPGKKRKSILGFFASLFNFGEKEEADLIDLAERRRRRQQQQKSPGKSEVERLAISAEMTVGELVDVLSRATGDDQEVIDSFEDDAEHWSGSMVRNTFIVFFYLVPASAAMLIGVSVGIDFAGGVISLMAIPLITLCVVFEAIPIILMLATSKLISRVIAGLRRSLPGALFIGFLFVLTAIGSAAAQWILFEHADLATPAAMIGAVIRVFALPLAEIAAAIALPILRKKSLGEHINVLKRKNDAKIAMNRQRIANELETINAAIRTKSDLQKEQDYQKKQDLANRLIDLIAAKVLKDAEKSLHDKGETTAASSSRSSYSRRRDEER
jgi:hypothetical protein